MIRPSAALDAFTTQSIRRRSICKKAFILSNQKAVPY
jgi:hypothetical protein